MTAVVTWIGIVALAGGWFLGNRSGYQNGHLDGLHDAPENFAAQTTERKRAEDLQHQRDLAYAAAKPSMMECLDTLGVDVTAIEEAVREDMIEDSMTEYDLRSDQY